MIASEFGSGKAGPIAENDDPCSCRPSGLLRAGGEAPRCHPHLLGPPLGTTALPAAPPPAGGGGGREEGWAGAYKAVTKPAEGTILTVMRESAVAARQALDAAAGDIVAVLEATVEEATPSLEGTPAL